MSILLFSQHAQDVIALITECEGIPVRCYPVRDHMASLDGYPESVLRHDADELLRIPNGPYRIPTPEEQDRYYQVQRAGKTVQEGHNA